MSICFQRNVFRFLALSKKTYRYSIYKSIIQGKAKYFHVLEAEINNLLKIIINYNT